MAGSRWVPVAHTIGLAVAAVLLAGCYTLEPTRGATPVPGSRIALDVNDAGRAALGGSMGPEIDQIEGRLVQHDSGEYLVAVSAVHLLRGGEQIWTGEQVRIKSSYVGMTYERQFSTSRTVALSAVGVAVVALFVTRSLLGNGSISSNEPIDTSHTLRVPIARPRLPHLSRP